MAAFAYTAINARGLELTGEISAPDAVAAREQLRVRGLLAELLEELPSAGQHGLRTAMKAVKPKSLQIFSRQFATMIEAGLNIVSALVILEQQTEDAYLAAVIKELRSDVEGGLLLSQALARHPKVFNRLFVSMVDPIIVFAFATLVLTGMLMFLVPIFEDIFKQLGGELPKLTQVVVDASHLLKDRWYIIFPGCIGAFFGFRRWKKTDAGRKRWDRFKLRVPMKIGDVVLKVTMARFSRTLSTLVAAGVDIIKALEITGHTSGNWVIEDALATVRAKVHEGVPIAQPLVENPIFPPMVSQMVKIGEETGELEKMLSKIADFYEDEVDAAISTLTSIIEPLMMIAVGMMVGVIIISMYLPMFKMLSLVK